MNRLVLCICVIIFSGCNYVTDLGVQNPPPTDSQSVSSTVSTLSASVRDSLVGVSEEDCKKLYKVCKGAGSFIYNDASDDMLVIHFLPVFNKVLQRYKITNIDKFEDVSGEFVHSVYDGKADAKVRDFEKELFFGFEDIAEGCRLAAEKASEIK